jgi:hypothetical protein
MMEINKHAYPIIINGKVGHNRINTPKPNEIILFTNIILTLLTMAF